MADLSTVSPWDAMAYFDTPRETTFSLTGPWQVIARANPQRVALIFSVNVGSNCQISISPTLPATGGGHNLSPNTNPIIFTHHDVGPLVQVEWQARTAGAATLAVTEIVLGKWPTETNNGRLETGNPTAERGVPDDYHIGQ